MPSTHPELMRTLEDALKESESRFRMLAEATSEGVVVHDRGRIVEVNRALCELSGYERAELLGRQAMDLVAPEDRDLCLRHMREDFDHPYEAAGLHKSGRRIPGEVRARTLHTNGGTLRVLSIRDIGERRRAEEALRRKDEELLQAQKMEAIGRLAGGVAHDFNNLLGVILGYLDFLERETPTGSPLRRRVEKIRQAAEHGTALTRQVLAFSRQDQPRPVSLYLGSVVTDTYHILRRAIGEDVRFAVESTGDLPPVKADPAGLQQVLLNLAVNARDAMPRGGRLVVRTSSADLSRHLEVHSGCLRPGRYARLSVQDTGRGMDAETLGRCFEPFFTTKGRAVGTGLGLSTVYGMVTAMGGGVRIRSVPGRGTRVDVYLPATEEPPTPEFPPDEGGLYAGNGERVLLVEDNGALREFCHEVLEDAGYSVLEAGSSEEALILVDQQRGRPDLLLTDVVMPGMSGRHLAGALRERLPALPVLYMSGYPEDVTGGLGVFEPSDRVLHKPFSAVELLRVLREILDGPAVAGLPGAGRATP